MPNVTKEVDVAPVKYAAVIKEFNLNNSEPKFINEPGIELAIPYNGQSCAKQFYSFYLLSAFLVLFYFIFI